jgi:hypothetical protein
MLRHIHWDSNMMHDEDTLRWILRCPMCGHNVIRWLSCYAAERLTIRPIGVRIECDGCRHQSPITPDKTAAIKEWVDDRDA